MHQQKPNLIVVTLDGLRRDKIEQIPAIKKMMDESFFLSNLVTAVPYTIGSLTSMFSGLYPYNHGVNAYFNIFKFDYTVAKTLVEYLKEQNYYCIFDALNVNLFPTKEFDETHPHKSEETEFKTRIISHIDSGIQKQQENQKTNQQPFFIYFQYSKIHHYSVEHTKGLDDFDKTYFSNQDENFQKYEKSIQGCDKFLNDLQEHLKKTGLDKNTVLMIHADHGTSCGEKPGEKMYGTYLYDYTTKVWACIKGPSLPIKKINQQVRTIDILPTLLEMLQIPKDSSKKMQGQSLLVAENEEIQERPAYLETGGLGGPNPSPKRHNLFALRFKNKKIIFNNTTKTWEYYDLIKDPQETNNLFETMQQDAEFQELRTKLLEHLKQQADISLE
ncbi:sulfatase-like hydrolase/transferase [archaeon]|jgi:arylsulfatase A-like enzyme|nr:sulfatase-like hydrolase/transferase [archaeon]MBT6761816.1 sulfatase-like hydrolase/transferase [archaeon]